MRDGLTETRKKAAQAAAVYMPDRRRCRCGATLQVTGMRADKARAWVAEWNFHHWFESEGEISRAGPHHGPLGGTRKKEVN